MTPGAPALIAIDWGTTSARAWCIDRNGAIIARRGAPLGVQQVADGDFAHALATLIGDWRDARVPRIASGMIGSRQGWVEAPYAQCPASLGTLADQLTFTPRRELAIVPGLLFRDDNGIPDVMRGEETQLAGAFADVDPAALAVLPGTHSKWAHVERGQVVAFRTFMTGELFALLLANSILGRLARTSRSNAEPGPAFSRGVARGLAGEALGHAIFGARTLALTEELAADEIADWLSGVLIGSEIHDARRWASRRLVETAIVHVIGADALVARYGIALAQAGWESRPGPDDAALRGLRGIAARARLGAK